jgi:CheY-like chemotaxis protein
MKITLFSQVAQPLEGMDILLAEDCMDQSRLYLTFLQTAGAKVTLECNGDGAVDTVKKSPTLFEAVVMDFNMPQMDGLIATRQLRELGYRGKIIAITASNDKELKPAWFEAGCDEYLEKPLTKITLINTLNSLFNSTTINACTSVKI